MRVLPVLILVSFLLSSHESRAGIIEDYFVTDENVIHQSGQAFSEPDERGKMNAYGAVFVRGDKVDQVVEIKSKKSNLSEGAKEALRDKIYGQLKMFFKPGDNNRTLSVKSDEFLWKSLNGVDESRKDGFWTFKNKNFVFVVTKSAYKSSHQDMKNFDELFGETGGKEYVKKYVGENSESNDELLKEELEVNYIRGSKNHYSWKINKNIKAKRNESSAAVEFKIANVIQVAKIANGEDRVSEIERLNNEITAWNAEDGHVLEKAKPENINLAERLKIVDSFDDSPNGNDPSHYIVAYTRDFISKYKVLNRSVSVTKVYKVDDHYVTFNYTIGVLGHKDCLNMQAEINGSNDVNTASDDNKNKVKEMVFKMIDKGFISSRNAAELGAAK